MSDPLVCSPFALLNKKKIVIARKPSLDVALTTLALSARQTAKMHHAIMCIDKMSAHDVHL